MGVEFNQELTGAIGLTHIVTPSINTFTIQTTMYNLQINLVTWKELV
jgi:hypothetical protein